jgi:hypothetical protein
MSALMLRAAGGLSIEPSFVANDAICESPAQDGEPARPIRHGVTTVVPIVSRVCDVLPTVICGTSAMAQPHSHAALLAIVIVFAPMRFRTARPGGL